MPKEAKLFKKNKSDNTKCQNLPDLSKLSEIQEKTVEILPEQFEDKLEEGDLQIDEERAEKKAPANGSQIYKIGDLSFMVIDDKVVYI
jgi:hypothetical protein